jgi:hypothetical protein
MFLALKQGASESATTDIAQPHYKKKCNYQYQAYRKREDPCAFGMHALR